MPDSEWCGNIIIQTTTLENVVINTLVNSALLISKSANWMNNATYIVQNKVQLPMCSLYTAAVPVHCTLYTWALSWEMQSADELQSIWYI